jgi:hypothetical protein
VQLPGYQKFLALKTNIKINMRMKIFRQQSNRCLNLLLKKGNFFGKIAGLLLIFSCVATSTLLARSNYHYNFNGKGIPAI